jgi:hypothetical protein
MHMHACVCARAHTHSNTHTNILTHMKHATPQGCVRVFLCVCERERAREKKCVCVCTQGTRAGLKSPAPDASPSWMQGRGCSAGSPGESYLFNNAGNNGVNKLADKGVNVSNW